jgi:hypothetical protein
MLTPTRLRRRGDRAESPDRSARCERLVFVPIVAYYGLLAAASVSPLFLH